MEILILKFNRVYFKLKYHYVIVDIKKFLFPLYEEVLSIYSKFIYIRDVEFGVFIISIE